MKNVLVVAGPTGCGKNSIIDGICKRVKNAKFLTNMTTRKMREGEVQGVNYHFTDNQSFLKEIENGNILEYYYRDDTDSYYGTYKPDIENKIQDGGIAISQIQIVGARYLKENFNTTTVFVVPDSLDLLEKRVRSRAAISDVEWEERKKHTEREMQEDRHFYDYVVVNKEGKLEEAVEEVLNIMKKEGFEMEFI
jgi:guanylate kinase